jgi:hypothetical protein
MQGLQTHHRRMQELFSQHTAFEVQAALVLTTRGMDGSRDGCVSDTRRSETGKYALSEKERTARVTLVGKMRDFEQRRRTKVRRLIIRFRYKC